MSIVAVQKITDKDITLKYLIAKNREEFSVEGVDAKYIAKFKDRNGYSLEEIEKSLADQGITEVNEETVEKVFGLIEVSKTIDISSATQGIILALKMSLNTLYCDSKYILNRFTGYFTDDPNNSEMVRLINTFNFQVKSVMDDLTFITFSNGQIASVPVSKTAATVKKYYDDWDYYYDDPNKLDNWDIREVNWINDDLQISIYLLDALIKIFPVNEEFASFKTILETALNVITEFNNSFKDIVILANSLDVIRVAPKTVIPKSDPVIFFNDPVTKSKVVKKKLYDVTVAKNIEGLVLGIVYEPEVADADGNFASEAVIEKAMINFMENYNQFDVMHDLNVLKSDKGEDRQVALIQNFIAPQDLDYDGRIVKKGTWLQQTKYYDPTILEKLAKGEYKGYSLYGNADIDSNDLVPAAT